MGGLDHATRELREVADIMRRGLTSAAPLGIILSMEGADPIVTPEQTAHWFELGLRAVGPAHYGRGQYAYGTASRSDRSEMFGNFG